jgi:hypothetical protein
MFDFAAVFQSMKYFSAKQCLKIASKVAAELPDHVSHITKGFVAQPANQ